MSIALRRAQQAVLEAAALLAASEQEGFDYEGLSNEEAFWLSQVAEDGSLPSQKAVERLKKRGLIDVYEHPKMLRDPALDQVYFMTDRGDAAMRAYQAYRARWA